MWWKIGKAAFEGNLLKKSIVYIFTKLPVHIVDKMDYLCGCIARWLYATFVSVKENQIMFIAFQGDFTCNPKYILSELLERNIPYNIVCSARRASLTNGTFPQNVKLVEQYSAGYYREIARSKIIVANSVEFLKKPTPIKKSQIIIETWHGSLGIKRFGAQDNKGKAWVRAGKRCGKYASYIISNSKFENDVYRDTFWKKTPILEYGHPRNDILFLKDEKIINELRLRILGERGVGENTRYILYAPTFRDDHKLDCYNIDFTRLTEAFAERFGGEWTVLTRLHPTVRKKAKEFNEKKGTNGTAKIIDVTTYPDIQELMLISDVAITDYSSWIYDFILTGKPGYIYATDIERYNTERGFYFPLETTPFPIAKNNDELIANVAAFDEEKYTEKLNTFLKGKGCIEDGHASERVAEKIIELMG